MCHLMSHAPLMSVCLMSVAHWHEVTHSPLCAHVTHSPLHMSHVAALQRTHGWPWQRCGTCAGRQRAPHSYGTTFTFIAGYVAPHSTGTLSRLDRGYLLYKRPYNTRCFVGTKMSDLQASCCKCYKYTYIYMYINIYNYIYIYININMYMQI